MFQVREPGTLAKRNDGTTITATEAESRASEELTLEEKAKNARRKGISCLLCGIKTHAIESLNRVPLTAPHVYRGTCINCYPSRVPEEILKIYQRKFASAIFRTDDQGRTQSEEKVESHEDDHTAAGSWAKDSFSAGRSAFQFVEGGSVVDAKSTTFSWDVCSRIDQQSACSDERSILTLESWEEFTIAAAGSSTFCKFRLP
jgi:hypothetical protein